MSQNLTQPEEIDLVYKEMSGQGGKLDALIADGMHRKGVVHHLGSDEREVGDAVQTAQPAKRNSRFMNP